jgi:prepilin-type N-terminal cleavage/methylation domain-containing protein
MKTSVANDKGFTLLELIVSMAIIGMIVAIALGGIRLATASREAGELKTDTYQRLRFIHEQINQKFRSFQPLFFDLEKNLILQTGAVPPPTPPNTPVKPRILAFEGLPTSLRFITHADPLSISDEKPGRFYEIQISLGRHPITGQTGILLVERKTSSDNIFLPLNPQDPDTHFTLLAQNIAYLKFRYYMLTKLPEKDVQAQIDLKTPQEKLIQYQGLWQESVPLPPPEPPGQPNPAATKAPPTDKVSIPRALEMAIGLVENQSSHPEIEPKVIDLPASIIPLYSGTEWLRLHIEVSNEPS